MAKSAAIVKHPDDRERLCQQREPLISAQHAACVRAGAHRRSGSGLHHRGQRLRILDELSIGGEIGAQANSEFLVNRQVFVVARHYRRGLLLLPMIVFAHGRLTFSPTKSNNSSSLYFGSQYKLS